MSFLFGGRPQLSSAEKLAAAETEVEMVSDLFNRYFLSPFAPSSISWIDKYYVAFPSHAPRSAYRQSTAKPNSTRARVSA